MNEKSKALTTVLIVVGLFFVMLLLMAFFTMKAIKGTGDNDFSSDGKGAIAVVEINGAIMTSEAIIERLHRAETSKDIKAIIIRVNSPGGAVAPTQEIYSEIVRVDKNVKPVYASFSSIAASGGYYIGAAARKIFSNRGTITGSIGVIMQFMDLSKLYEFVKINPQTIKAGLYKDIGQPNRSLTSEERALLNKTITNVHGQFMQDIMNRRKDKIKREIITLAQGQIYSGEEAKKLGLVDELGSLWDAGRYIHKELKLEGEFTEFKFIKKKKKMSWLDIAENLGETSSKFSSLLDQVQAPALLFR